MIADTIVKHETRTQKMWRGDNNILYVKALPGEGHALEDAWENHNINKKLSRGQKLPVLTDMREIGKMNREARVFYASEENGIYIKVLALIVDNSFSRMMGNFFIKLNQPRFPTRLFTSEEAATQWLLNYSETG